MISHEEPLPASHPKYNGSPVNLRIESGNREITNEPLNAIAMGELVYCDMYATETVS